MSIDKAHHVIFPMIGPFPEESVDRYQNHIIVELPGLRFFSRTPRLLPRIAQARVQPVHERGLEISPLAVLSTAPSLDALSRDDSHI